MWAPTAPPGQGQGWCGLCPSGAGKAWKGWESPGFCFWDACYEIWLLMCFEYVSTSFFFFPSFMLPSCVWLLHSGACAANQINNLMLSYYNTACFFLHYWKILLSVYPDNFLPRKENLLTLMHFLFYFKNTLHVATFFFFWAALSMLKMEDFRRFYHFIFLRWLSSSHRKLFCRKPVWSVAGAAVGRPGPPQPCGSVHTWGRAPGQHRLPAAAEQPHLQMCFVQKRALHSSLVQVRVATVRNTLKKNPINSWLLK